MKVDLDLIAGAANTIASSVCWTVIQSSPLDFYEIIAYSLHNLIAIVDVHTSKVTQTLRGHKGRINVLKASGCYLISGGQDGDVRLWNMGLDSIWQEVATLSGLMRSSIVALSCLDITSGLIIAASDSSGKVVIWLKSSELTVLQVIDMPPAQMPHDLHLVELPTSISSVDVFQPDILLFIGSVDARIHIRIASQENMKIISNDSNNKRYEEDTSLFKVAGVVAGHEEWVTCLASMIIDDRTLLLASGSKDSKIRIWRIVLSPISGKLLTELNDFKSLRLDEEEEEEEDAVEADGAVELDPDESLSEARLIFETPSCLVSVFLEALLVGHEDWVTSVHWMNSNGKKSINMNKAHMANKHRLYSTSMDRLVYIQNILSISLLFYF
jgi:elongator complex protein 2